MVAKTSLAVFEILRSKRIGVTSLTFQGHVTSSVTWSIDSRRPFAIGGPIYSMVNVTQWLTLP